jgi:hypothetical protein
MNAKTNPILLAAICSLFVLLSLWGIIWYATNDLLKGSIDGILLVLICLMIGCIFSAQLFLIIRSLGWAKLLQAKGCGTCGSQGIDSFG